MTDTIQTSVHGHRLGINKSGQLVVQNPDTGATYAMTRVPNAANEINSDSQAANIGTVGTTSGLSGTITQLAPGLARLDFTLTSVALTMTDAGASGASASLKLIDLVAGAWQSLGSRTNLSAIASDTTLDVAGDLALIHALGSVAADAGDLALTGTEVDIGAVSGTVTLSSNAGSSATVIKGPGAAAVDGTSTASDIYLNFSASAATADATGVLTVTGTITILLASLGDD